MLKLHKLESITKPRKRVGRGGKRGGTSGRGDNGQRSRSGGRSEIKPYFEGGQMSLVRRLPKRGFKNHAFAVEYDIINLSDLERSFDAGATVDLDMLRTCRLVKGRNPKVKLLGNGALTKGMKVCVHAVSKSAQDEVKKAGGEVVLLGE
jgi:large subunit ribosomal protein L15